MNLNKNYYSILGISNISEEKDIKNAYRNLSKKYHPDVNKDIDISLFNDITEAYNVLCGEDKQNYDQKSKFGNSYNEYFELFDVDFNYNYKDNKDKYDAFKKNEVNNIIIKIDVDTFDGSLEYERWVRCKPCDGSGKDLSSKIIIKDINGNITKIFDSEDGCDLCEGTGKYMEQDCFFCHGKGKVGLTPCNSCQGEKRILGKQKLTNIKLKGDETKIESMGHFSKNGKVGYLLLTNN